MEGKNKRKILLHLTNHLLNLKKKESRGKGGKMVIIHHTTLLLSFLTTFMPLNSFLITSYL